LKIKLLYIDLFCGAGGTSTGVENARYNGKKCAKVIACVNHDANAIASHAANHPAALHFTEDIRTLKLSPLVAHIKKMKSKYPAAKVVMWASLECTNFSKAKGGQPRDADSRTLAEHLFRYIEAINPDYIQIENVEEFMSWGDLDEHGKPVSRDAGRLYHKWVTNVKAYGYEFDYRILNAADYGAYTSRRRYFGTFARPQLPVVFPAPTHTKNPEKGLFAAPLKKWKPVKDVLDFSKEGESIFTRKKPLADKTLERIYAGLIKFVAGGKDKWLLKYNSVNGATGKHVPPSIDEPCPVVSCQSRLGIVQATFLTTYYGNGGVHSIDAPSPVVTTVDRIAKVSPRFIVNEYSGGGQHSSIDDVCPAVLTTPKQKVVSCKWILNTNFDNVGSDIDSPAPTITANRKWHYLMNPQFASAGSSIDNPCFTLIARMDKMPPYLIVTETGAVAIEVYETDTEPMRKIKEFMALYGIVDIKMRMLLIDELKQIMGFGKDYILIGTQAEQKKYIGNAVETTTARVQCEALVEKIYEYELKQAA